MNKEQALKVVMTALAWIVSVVLAFGAVKQDVAVMKAIQELQYREIQRQLEDIKATVRLLEERTRER